MEHKEKLIINLKTKLLRDNKTLKKFISEYIPEAKYSTILSQINGFNQLQDYLENAIQRYLEG